MPQSLIVPLDGSPLGEAALPWASLFAKTRGLSLTLVRVVPWPPDLPLGEFDSYISPEVYEQIIDADRETAASYLEQVRGRLSAEGLAATAVVREGTAAENIHDLADELGAYAIAMASHGRGGLERLVLGSVAERVLQQATIPVLLIRAREGEAAPTASLERLLVPLDGSALAERALELAREVAVPGTTLVLARVVEPIEQLEPAVDEPVAIVDEEATQRAVAEAEAYLHGVAQSLQTAKLSTEIAVRRGRPGRELLAAIQDLRADLVVMTTHGHTGPARWLIGSVADEVFRHSEHPLLVVSARTLAARVAGPYTVADLMTRDLAVVREDEPIIAVVRKLIRRRVSGAPVVNAEAELVGIVSEHDLLAWHRKLVEQLSKGDASLDPAEYVQHLENDSVDQIMNHPAISIEESADLSAAINLFLDRRMRRLAVTRDGRLAGILSRADVLKAMAARWESAGPPHDRGSGRR